MFISTYWLIGHIQALVTAKVSNEISLQRVSITTLNRKAGVIKNRMQKKNGNKSKGKVNARDAA